MVREELSKKDWELLSAYVDGELQGKNLKYVEDRLKTDARLQHALEDMQQMKSAMAQVRHVRAPRNFTITAEMAGQKPRERQMYMAFRFASVLASVLFVVFVMSDVFLLRSVAPVRFETSAPAMEMAEKEMAQEELLTTQVQVTPEELLAVPAEPENVQQPAENEAEGVEEEVRGETMAEVPEAGEVTQFSSAPLPTQVSDMEVEKSAPAGDIGEDLITSTPVATGTQIQLPYIAQEGGEETTEFSEAATPTFVPTPVPQLYAQEPMPSSVLWVRVLEVALGAAALLFGVFALLLRKR